MERFGDRTIRVTVTPQLNPDQVHLLAERLVAQLAAGDVDDVFVDVGAVRAPDVCYLDALGRLALAARRHGARIRLVDPCPRLLELLTLAGLDDVLGRDGT